MVSLGTPLTAQSPSTKKRWPKGWQSHCMAGGTAPPWDRATRRALQRKGRWGGGRAGWGVGVKVGGTQSWVPGDTQGTSPAPPSPAVEGAAPHSRPRSGSSGAGWP